MSNNMVDVAIAGVMLAACSFTLQTFNNVSSKEVSVEHALQKAGACFLHCIQVLAPNIVKVVFAEIHLALETSSLR